MQLLGLGIINYHNRGTLSYCINVPLNLTQYLVCAYSDGADISTLYAQWRTLTAFPYWKESWHKCSYTRELPLSSEDHTHMQRNNVNWVEATENVQYDYHDSQHGAPIVLYLL